MFPLSLRHPTYRYLATLPTDPTALHDEIYRVAATIPDVEYVLVANAGQTP